MQLDIKKAFLSPFSDHEWKSKLSILTILGVFLVFQCFKNPNLKQFNVIAEILFLPFSFLNIGYCVKFAHNEIHKIKPLLPVWEFDFLLEYFKYGLLFLVISWIYIICFIIICLPMALLLNHFNIIYLCIFILFSMYLFVIIHSLAINLYADNFKFKEAFNIRYLFNLIKNVKKELFLSILIVIPIGIPYFILVIVYKIPFNIFNVVILSFFGSIIDLIVRNVFAQIYKIAKSKLSINGAAS